MNLYILLGAACWDEAFAQKLLSDPLAAAQDLGLQLTPGEIDWLNNAMAAGRSNGLIDVFRELRGRICPPGGVCPGLPLPPPPPPPPNPQQQQSGSSSGTQSSSTRGKH
ncbi:MAG TPA: hypothetical protein VH437_05340 [Terriglobales bacterium]|jgi:hypothetical protein